MHIGELSRFSPKVLNLTLPKYFVGEPFCVSENVWYVKKKHEQWAEGVRFFRRKIFVIRCRNFLWVNPFVFQKVLGIEKCFA